MEDSFRVRVDKAFGSLSSPSPSDKITSSSLSSLWCLTDDEIERKEWNREKDSLEREPDAPPGPYGSNGSFANPTAEKKPVDYRIELEKDLDELEDEDDVLEEQPRSRAYSSKSAKPDDYNDEEWEIKSSIGFDCSLDNEEEEDHYDKVAIGKEKSGDRLYMSEVNDYSIEVDTCDELPDSFKDVTRDPRADPLAAKIRLREDAYTAEKMHSLRVSENDAPAAANAQINSSEDVNLKSILKRKDAYADPKLQKRVRFDSDCKDDYEKGSEGLESNVMETFSTEETSGIPDYMWNPSKYTRYTFDSGDVDEPSNKQAYMDFLNLLKRRNATEPEPDDTPFDLPKSVTFIPRKKTGDATMLESWTVSKQNQDDAWKESVSRRGFAISIAAEETKDNEVCAMEEDEPEIGSDKRSGAQKSSRQYRMKAKSISDES